MRCRVVSSLVLFVFLANGLFVQAADSSGTLSTGIPWAGTVRDGLKQALINQKQILLYFYAPDLAACTSVEQQTLGNAEVQQAITANYIPVKINVREVPATAKFYQANDDSQLPRVLILSADDKVVSGFTASSNPSEFVAQVKASVNNSPTNPKLEQLDSLAKTASSFLTPTAEPTAAANAALAENTTNKPASAVTPTAWQPGATGTDTNALLLPNFAPNSPVPVTSPASNDGPALAAATPATTPGKSSLLPTAVGSLVRANGGEVTFGGATAAAAPAIPSLANYGMTGVTAPATAAAPGGYGMQNLAAAAQPYQQQAQQTVSQWQNTANQTLANAQTQANQSLNTAQQQVNATQQNLQNQIGAATNNLASAAPAVGSYDAGLSPRPSATQGAGLATIPGLGGATASAGSVPSTQPAGAPYSLNGVTASTAPTTQPAAVQPTYNPTVAAAVPAATNFALAPGTGYGIPNNAPPVPALPGHPKEKAGLANYSTDNLQGYLGNGSKPVLPSAQVNAANAAMPALSAVPPVGNFVAAAPNAAIQPPTNPAPQIGLQGQCPVTIAESRKWAKGDPQFGAVHRGKTYLFVSAAEQQKFLAAPDKYCPVLGGNDPVVMFHEGRFIAGTPALAGMYKNRMYLFSNPAAKTEFEANPTKYEQAVSVAETQAGIIVR